MNGADVAGCSENDLGAFRLMLNSFPALAWMLELPAGILALNRNWVEYAGGATSTDAESYWEQVIHPDDLGSFSGEMARAMILGKTFVLEARLRRADGAYRWMLNTGAPRCDQDGAVCGYIGYCTDITDNKMAEEQLAVLVDSLELGIEERTRDLRRVNTELEAEVNARRDLEQMLRAEKRELIHMQREISDAYDKLKLSQERVLQQEKMASIGQLAAGIAHEINNPLGFILSNLNSLRRFVHRLCVFVEEVSAALEDSGDRERVQALRAANDIDFILEDLPALVDECREGGERVKRIIQDLKAFSHRDEGGDEAVDLNACLESSLNMVWNEIKYRAAVDKELLPLPMIRSRGNQINQVIMNLLINAAHAVERDGHIRVRSWQDGVRVHLAVTDNGCGIPEENLSRIFDPFFTTKEVGQGSGLGLSLSYDIVHNLGGELTVRSQVGAGAEFTLSLPLEPSL